ncbi:MAG TPA: D-2-hydroxyacid dehydrogenase [Verrucomicrobiales bacterium]|nr:D-2-hydroxyacid dehydrogenase [Verrucomicrobiales bacterium]
MSRRIVFLDAATVGNDVSLSPLERHGSLSVFPATSPLETAERIAEAEVVVTNKVPLGAERLAEAPSLRLVAIAATGSDHVDLAAAKKLGIAVCCVRGYSTAGVAQHAIALLLNLATHQHLFSRETQLWPASPIFTRLAHPVVELEGKTLGIAGAGAIGSRTGEIAVALGMRVQCLARPGSANAAHPEWPRVDCHTFFQSSDAVSLHCPLTAGTAKMIGPRSLDLMPSHAFLINTSRGALIDEEALAEALRHHRIAGAALDVLSTEPPPPGHPLLDPSIPNLLITPHSAWIARETRQRLIDEIAANLETFLAGRSRNRLV